MYDLKKELNEKFYNDIIKCNFLNELAEMVNDEKATINIRIDELKDFSSLEVVGVISKESNDPCEKYEMTSRISDKIPTQYILNILISNNDFNFKDVDNVIDNVSSLGHIKGGLYGLKKDENLKSKFKIQVIYLHDKNVKIDDQQNDLIYNIVLHFIDGNSISVSEIQKKFCLGLNKSLNIFERLEKLGIISSKSNNKRELLINNKEKIKELIY